jgi:hypothetical protein
MGDGHEDEGGHKDEDDCEVQFVGFRFEEGTL